MTDFRDLKELAGQEAISAWRGIVSKTATDFTDLVPVVLPDYDEHLEWGPCPWQSRDATSLPAKGDKCLVVFDNTRVPWIIAWWPYS